MDRKSIIVAIILIVLGSGYYWWTQSNKQAVLPDRTNALGELPIEDQIKAQVDALQTKSEVPLPIPIIIGRSSVTTLDKKRLESTLKKEGFTTDGEPEITKSDRSRLEVYSRYFIHQLSGNYVNIMSVKSDYGISGWLGADINKSFRKSATDSPAKVKKADNGIVGVGPLRIGMTKSQVRKVLSHIPHDSMKDSFLEKVRKRKITCITLEDAESITESLFPIKSDRIHLSRGKYLYTLQFVKGVFVSLGVSDNTPLLGSV